MFSFIFINEKDDTDDIDYVLMAPIPNILYDFIAKMGKVVLKLLTDKNDTQIGYV